jgi:hypothetical protein
MQDYIRGILEENTPTEAYHGITFSRRLVIRTIHGKQMTIDDPDAITENLRTGQSYDFVVVVSGAEKVRAFTQSITKTGKLSGTIRALKWAPNTEKYQLHDTALISQPMSVVGTVNGNVLLPRMLLGGVSVGNAVTWGIDQFQLVAVHKTE